MNWVSLSETGWASGGISRQETGSGGGGEVEEEEEEEGMSPAHKRLFSSIV